MIKKWINWLHIFSARKGCHLRLLHWMTLCIIIRQHFSHQKANADIFHQLQNFNAGNDLPQENYCSFFWSLGFLRKALWVKFLNNFFFPRSNYQQIVPQQNTLLFKKKSRANKVLSLCTSSQEQIQKTQQCSTAKQRFVKKGVQWSFPLCTSTQGQNR